MNAWRPTLVVVSSLVVCPLVLGQAWPSVEELTVREDVVVTANPVATQQQSVGSAVTVLTHEEIAARGTDSLVELLRGLPGVDVVQGGGPGSTASVFLRGSNSSHTLVLLDGLRLNAATTGAVDLAGLRASAVERIEVLRGPQSSLYGSEAMGGVISIITRRGERGLGADVETEAGSLGLRRWRLGAGGGDGRWDWRVSAGRERSDGVSVASERAGNREHDPHVDGSAVALVGVRVGQAGRLQVSWRALDASADLDGFTFGVGPTDDPNFRQRRRASSGAAVLETAVTPWWRQTVRVGVSGETLQGRDPDTSLNRYDIATRTTDVEVGADLQAGRCHLVSLGASLERRTGDVEGGYDARADVRAVFATSQWAWGETGAFTAAIRRDDHSVFGTRTTYRATGVLRLGGGAPRLHASWGTGFKAPTFNDLYYPYYGNPGLRPEASRGWDVGLSWESAGDVVRADLTHFRSRYDDLVAFDWGTFRAENVARARVRGWEASGSARLTGRWRAAVSYTYTDAEDLATGRALPRRPRHKMAASVLATGPGRLSGSLTWVAVRRRFESDGTRMDAYSRLDLAAQLHVLKWLDATVRVQNALDRAYEEVPGYTSPGRTVVLGARALLNKR